MRTKLNTYKKAKKDIKLSMNKLLKNWKQLLMETKKNGFKKNQIFS